MTTEITFRSGSDVELIQYCGSDEMILRSAWVSTKGDVSKDEAIPDDKLRGTINYLMKHRHGTPFEHNSMTFFVRAPIFVWREWHRHRIGFSYNEESGRYKQLDPVFYVSPFDRPCRKVDGWKPGRPKFLSCVEAVDVASLADLNSRVMASCEEAYTAYVANLDAGFDPGLARVCLPVGIYSSCWVTCNARSLMAFLSLRIEDHSAMFVSYPLFEIDEAARKVEEIFASLFPVTHEAFAQNGRVAP